ncbi:MAG: hypothetical protein V1733_07940 [bacterium]
MKIFSVVSFLTLVILLGSCTPEYKLAQEFHKSPPDFNLLVMAPDFLYKYNHKGERIDGFADMNEAQQDSALFWSSDFVQYLSDSTFLEIYMNNFLDELRRLHFTVYLDSAVDSFLMQQPQSYVVNIAQLQVDEYTYPYEDEEYFSDTLFIKRFELNAVDVSVWLELSKLNSSKGSRTALYTSHMANDDVAGNFGIDPFSLNVQYHYRIDSLALSGIYDMAGYLGKIHASYLYDFFLNQYIAYHLPQGYETPVYYHYNRFRRSFVPVEEDRFELLDR